MDHRGQVKLCACSLVLRPSPLWVIGDKDQVLVSAHLFTKQLNELESYAFHIQ